MAIIEDVTDRKGIDASAADPGLADAAIESLSGLFCLINENGFIEKWNVALEKLSGYADHEISTMKFQELFDDNTGSILPDLMLQALEHGTATSDTGLLSKGGHCVPIILNLKHIETGAGTYIAATGTDLTEHIKLKEKIAR